MAIDSTLIDDLNTACFESLGQSVTFNGVTIDAIFDDESTSLSGLGIGMEATEPQLKCKTADVAGAGENAEAVINGKAYRVVGPGEPDGTGTTTFRLEAL